jgi:phage tail-like protein
MEVANKPLSAFHFKVDFLFTESDKGKYFAPCDAYFMEVSGLEASLDFEKQHEYSELGNNSGSIHFPSSRKFSLLRLKRGLLKDAKLFKWFNDSLTSLEVKPISMLVHLLDLAKAPMATWQLYEAFPQKWTYSPFDAMKSTYVVENIEIKYKYFDKIL